LCGNSEPTSATIRHETPQCGTQNGIQRGIKSPRLFEFAHFVGQIPKSQLSVNVRGHNRRGVPHQLLRVL